jgi:hypothetical protein
MKWRKSDTKGIATDSQAREGKARRKELPPDTQEEEEEAWATIILSLWI